MKIQSRLMTSLVSALIVGLARLLYRTVSIKFIEADPSTNPFTATGGPAVIFCIWHESILSPLFAGKHRRMVALVSRHRDGSLLARTLQRINIGLVRGSSSRGGATAMLEMLDLPANKHITITPDGPRGPRRLVKAGPIFLASRTGRPIVPTAFVPARCWRVQGTWTDLQIPKPFTTVHAILGQPITYKPDLSRDELHAAERELQAAMDGVQQLAEALARADSPTLPWNAVSQQAA